MIEKKMLPTIASFLVSEDCNLACTYCFELEGRTNCNKHMTKEVALKGIEFLCENAIKNGGNRFGAMLFGGEPLLRPDIVEVILKRGVELARENNMRFSASMVTNATILNDKIKYILSKYMKETDLNVQLSVDGIKEIHDKYRITKNGKGSFDMIAKNIDGWKELFSDNIYNLSIHGCSNHETLPYLFENYKFFREEWDVPRLWFIPIATEENYTQEDVVIYKEQLSKIMEYTLERAKQEKSPQEILNYAPLDRCLSPDSRPDAPCGAGKSFITITANGDLYPCHSFYYNDPNKTTRLGDLWKGIHEPNRKIFIEFDNNDMSCAKDCPDCDAYHCYRCIADNWAVNGSMLSQITGYKCQMSKIERELQVKTREELNKMGLLHNRDEAMTNTGKGNNPDNPDCLCDVRTNEQGLQEISQDSCQCGNGSTESEKTIALALKTILDKIESLEVGQDFIVKKLLK